MPYFQQAIVVGASSGIGEAIATQLAQSGTRVALIARRADVLTKLVATLGGEAHALAYTYDVRDVESVRVLFQQIAHDLGGLDLVVYAAGIMPEVGPDEYPTITDRDIIDINLTGAIAWLNEAGARFAQTGNGTIIGLGSVAGDRGRRGNLAYGASKAALASYLESLRNRLTVKGVAVLTAKPGYVATPMLAGAKIPKFLPVISSDRAARLILKAAEQKRQIAYIPGVWTVIMGIIKAVPSRVFRRLNI